MRRPFTAASHPVQSLRVRGAYNAAHDEVARPSCLLFTHRLTVPLSFPCCKRPCRGRPRPRHAGGSRPGRYGRGDSRRHRHRQPRRRRGGRRGDRQAAASSALPIYGPAPTRSKPCSTVFRPSETRSSSSPARRSIVAFKLVPAFGETVEVVAEAVQTGEVAILESRRESAGRQRLDFRRGDPQDARLERGERGRAAHRRHADRRQIRLRARSRRALQRHDHQRLVAADDRDREARRSARSLSGQAARDRQRREDVHARQAGRLRQRRRGDDHHAVPERPRRQGQPRHVAITAARPASRSAATPADSSRSGKRRPAHSRPASPTEFVQRRSILDPERLHARGAGRRSARRFIGDWTGDEISSAQPAHGLLAHVRQHLRTPRRRALRRLESRLRRRRRRAALLRLRRRRRARRRSTTTTCISDRETASTGLVGNLSFRLNDANRLFLNSVLTRDASSEDRFQEGLQTNSGGDIRDFRVRYQLEEILLHAPARRAQSRRSRRSAVSFEWSLDALGGHERFRPAREHLSRVRSRRLRAADRLRRLGQAGVLQSRRRDRAGRPLATPSSSRRANGTWSGSLKAGLDRIERTRDFEARRFRFVHVGLTQQFDLTADARRDLHRREHRSERLRDPRDHRRQRRLRRRAHDRRRVSDDRHDVRQVARHRRRALRSTPIRACTTFNPFDVDERRRVGQREQRRAAVAERRLSARAADESALRLTAARSIVRSSASSARSRSPKSPAAVRWPGIPISSRPRIDGFDLRWETFPGAGEVIAASAFYKKIDKPIERIVQPTTRSAASRSSTPTAATLWGLELEFRRSLESLLPALRLWSVNVELRVHPVGRHGRRAAAFGGHEHGASAGRAVRSDRAISRCSSITRSGARWSASSVSYSGERLTDVGRIRSSRHLRSRRSRRSTSCSRRVSALRAKGSRSSSPARICSTRSASSSRAARSSAASIRAARSSLSLSYSPF